MHLPALADNEVANFLKIAEPTFHSEISPKTFYSEGSDALPVWLLVLIIGCSIFTMFDPCILMRLNHCNCKNSF
jgi:hypothetical protein